MNRAEPSPWRCFVALGDSVTEGFVDPTPGGELRGWANRLAEALAGLRDDFAFTNLATRGVTTEEVRTGQLPHALSLRPDLAAVLVGMNDLIRPEFDPGAFERSLGEIVGSLSEAGATVLTATFPDITAFVRLPGRFTAGFRGRLVEASRVVREISSADGIVCVDADLVPEAQDPRVCSVDRLHPSPRGHLVLARAFADQLGARSGTVISLPHPDDDESAAGRLAQLRWLLTNVSLRDALRTTRRMRAAR